MILGKERHVHAACFDELSDAVDALMTSVKTHRRVVFNAHAFPFLVPKDAIIYNLENVGVQIKADAFFDHEIWDFSHRNASELRNGRTDRRKPVKHVPVGHHPSMERFQPLPWKDRDIDVVFAGCMNVRRGIVMNALAQHGFKTHTIEAMYGPGRDAILARAKIAINMLFYEEGTFPVLRTAHYVSNSLATISESANEAPSWAYPEPVAYHFIVKKCRELLAGGEESATATAAEALRRFREHPLKLPKVDNE